MCPPGYNHMATPKLEHGMYSYTLGKIALWSHKSAQTTNSAHA